MKASNVEWIEYKHVVKTEAMMELEKELEKLEDELKHASENSKPTLCKTYTTLPNTFQQ